MDNVKVIELTLSEGKVNYIRFEEPFNDYYVMQDIADFKQYRIYKTNSVLGKPANQINFESLPIDVKNILTKYLASCNIVL